MSTISSFDQALDFLPESGTKKSPILGLFSKIRIVWDAIGEGNAAASRYQELTARGKSPSEAAAKVFAEHYGVR